MKEEKIYSGVELFNLKQDPDNYIIEGFLWERQNVILLAKEKVGKSILALQMACNISSGDAFLGEYEIPEAMHVLYIQTESTQHETIERLRAMTHKDGVHWDPNNFFLMSTHSMELDNDECLTLLIQDIKAKEAHPKVIILDPLYMSMKGSLSDDEKSRDLSRNIRKLADEFHCAVVVVHHEHRGKRNKEGGAIEEGDDSIMGSFVWKAFPNHIVRLQKKSCGTRMLSCGTQRSSRVIENMNLELVEPLPLMFKIKDTADCPSYVKTVEGWMKRQEEGQHAQQISDSTGLSLSAVKKSLAYLTKGLKRRVIKINPGKRPTLYKYIIESGDSTESVPPNSV